MYGRYGMDELSKFLSYAGLAVLIISMFLPQSVKTFVFLLAVLLVGLTYFRTFSRNIGKRRAENTKYLQRRQRVADALRLRREMWKQRKSFKFFKCPSCKAVLRVPKGKGKLRIVCKKCGTAFEKKT